MTFTINVTLPFENVHWPESFVSVDAVQAVSRAAEQAGFHAACVTDHPAPSQRWLENGGHTAQDPFVLMGMVAACTTRLRVRTGILVLPYRNPFITARAASTLDAFSGGRVELGLGAGYMKREYAALGVDFDTRNDLMDEYMRAMRTAWSGEVFSFEGTGYAASDIRILPAPVQDPLPLLVGGNSRRAIRRAVELGDAWYPFFSPKIVTDTARSANIEDEDDLRASIAHMHDHCARIGRETPPALVISGMYGMNGSDWNAQQALDRIGELRALGFAGGDVGIHTSSRSEWTDNALRFGKDVIAKLD